jgi:hypothetical protein
MKGTDYRVYENFFATFRNKKKAKKFVTELNRVCEEFDVYPQFRVTVYPWDSEAPMGMG